MWWHDERSVSFKINQGEIVSLIGANGAGKTTILKTISGLLKSVGGTITYEGKNLQKQNAPKVAALLFHRYQKVVISSLECLYGKTCKWARSFKIIGAEIDASFETVYSRFPVLKERLNQDAATLSGGEQQMLAMGGHWCLSRSYSYWMNLQWGWLRFLLMKFSIS